MPARRGLRRRALTASALLVAVAAHAAGADAVGVRRLLALVGGVAGEYAEAVDAQGRIVRPIELDEARLLLAEARDEARRLGAAAPADVDDALAGLGAALDAHASAEAVAARAEAVRHAVEAATGVADESLPPAAPSAERGAALYRADCTGCHGERGDGDGPDAARLARRPADFTDAEFLAGETPADFARVVALGRRTAAMPAWGDVLSLQDRWDVVSYVWSLGAAPAAVADGQAIFVRACAGCHRAGGDAGPVTLARLATRTDGELADAVAHGVPGTTMPAFGDRLTAAERAGVVAFVRQLSLGLPAPAVPGATGADVPAPAAALAEVRRAVHDAVDAYRLGADDAGVRTADAYLRFEPLEPAISARDPAAVRRVEREFLGLRLAIRQRAVVPEVEAAAAAVDRALDGAAATLRDRPRAPWAAPLVALALGAAALFAVRRHRARPRSASTRCGPTASRPAGR